MKRYQKMFCVVAGVAVLALAGCDKAGPAASGEGVGGVNEGGEAVAATMEVESLEAEAVAAILSGEGAPMVLDIRTEEEFGEGHLAGAVNIVYGEDGFAEALGELDPEQTYVVHCRSGRRSTEAMPTFEELGFRKIIHLKGGMNSWVEAGQAVEK
jgi:phage shock protein E